MANRFWVGGTGSWDATTTRWSATSGGAAGATVPTAADDVYFDAASGGGTVTVNTATRLCLSLSFRGTSGSSDFTGSFASSGVGTNTISGGLTLSPSATYSGYTATITFNAAVGYNITTNGKALYANITFSNVNGTWNFTDSLTTQPTNTVTLTGGTLTVSVSAPTQYWGLFSSSGSTTRVLYIAGLELSGSGTVWNTAIATNLTIAPNYVKLTDTSSNTKTFTHSTTLPFGSSKVSIEGSGSGAYNISGNFSDNDNLFISNTGGAIITVTGTIFSIYTANYSTKVPNACNGSLVLGTGTILTQGNLDFTGCSANFAFNTPTANTLSVNGNAYIILDPLMTVTSTPTTTFAASGGVLYTNGKTWLSPITLNSPLSSTIFADSTGIFISTSTVTLTAGDLYVYADNGFTIYGKLQVSTLSVTGTTARSINAQELILTGSGTLITSTTTTALGWSVQIVRVAGTQTVARTLTFNTVVNPQSGQFYFEGTGTGGLTLAPGTTGVMAVFVTNTGTATPFSISTGTIYTLNFTGSTVNWNNAATQTVTITGSITLGSGMTTTVTPAIILNGANAINQIIRCNGRSFVTGGMTINDSGNNVTYTFADAFSSNAAFTITNSGTAVNINGGMTLTTGAFTLTTGTLNINSNLSISSVSTFTITAGNLNVNNGANITVGLVSCLNAGIRTINMGSGRWTLTGTGTVWNFATATNTTVNAQQSTILINDTSNTAITFAGGTSSSFTYYTVEFARGASTGTIAITSGASVSPVITSTFANFINNTSTAAHIMSFTGGANLAFYKFNVKGFSSSVRISFNRNGAAATNFIKLGQGIVSNADNLTISGGQQICTPGLTWYAGAGSTGAPNSWLAGNAPSSQSLLGSGGVG